MKKVFVQYDGSNFYNKVKKILPNVHLTSFNYFGLAKFIAKITPIKIVYYVGEIRKYPGNKKSEKLYASQQSLFLNHKTTLDLTVGVLSFIQILIGFALNLFCPGSQYILQSFVN